LKEFISTAVRRSTWSTGIASFMPRLPRAPLNRKQYFIDILNALKKKDGDAMF
jgi:hypothetical protein